ncbi:MAG: sn-glycerol-1-phosphate dehydrogenase [Thermoproteota archaeon]|nr:iron-containing alcohol dehydrogenase [Candidatus Brockarchaeota archaeon]MBO3768469.1 iron-containing alcohol dehydrogenase [Candidatus Brockarchaeota archaeon]MBO3801360.1 iron-containing alcohol dehydrogenase [Candidatus Brockarchaeota archaeon]
MRTESAKIRHKIELPKLVLAGEEIISSVGEELKKIEVRKVLIITSKTPYSLFKDKLVSSLNSESIKFRFLVDTFKTHKETIENFFSNEFLKEADTVAGFGGGKVIDVSKLIAEQKSKNFISIPTVPSHDGIASPLVSLPAEDRWYSRFSKTPLAVFADIEILSKAPQVYVSSGFGDIIGKLTAIKDWRLAHLLTGEYYGEYAAQQAKSCADSIIKKSEEIGTKSKEGVRALVEALISCGIVISIAGSSRPCSGSEHLFAHALDYVANFPSTHGLEVGIGTIMMSYLHDMDWMEIKENLEKAKAATTAKEIGVGEEQVVKALSLAAKIRPERYTILGEKGLTIEAATNLAKVTKVIKS